MPHYELATGSAASIERRRAGVARDSSRVLLAVPWLAVAAVILWVSVGVGTSTGQWGDHFEQFVWAHGVELGYHKHPPLPTWMLAATIALLGPAVHWTHVLATICVAATALLTYGVARELLGRPAATLALLLWGLQQPFSARAHLFNHNTVLVLCTSATAWLLLRALQPGRSPRWWLAVGAGAGLALLAKYQAVVPLAGLILALALSGELASPQVRRGVLVAATVALAICLPHAVWVAGHGFSSVAYATQQGTSLDAASRAGSIVSFLAQQLRFVFPALLCAGLLMLLPGPRTQPVDAGRNDQRRRAWLVGLIAFPLLATLAVCPLFGIDLQNHWGNQALQFLSLWLAWQVRPLVLVACPAWLALAVASHGVFIALALNNAAPSAGDTSRRADNLFPAQALADAVRRDWQDRSLCPLRVVVGPSFEAGIVSVYNGGDAMVLEDNDFAKSPWIRPDDLQRYGAVYVATDPVQLPTREAVVVASLDVGAFSPRPRHRIYWAIVPPEICVDDAWPRR